MNPRRISFLELLLVARLAELAKSTLDPECVGDKTLIADSGTCTTLSSTDEQTCNSHTAKLGGGMLTECGWVNGNCLSVGPFCTTGGGPTRPTMHSWDFRNCVDSQPVQDANGGPAATPTPTTDADTKVTCEAGEGFKATSGGSYTIPSILFGDAVSIEVYWKSTYPVTWGTPVYKFSSGKMSYEQFLDHDGWDYYMQAVGETGQSSGVRTRKANNAGGYRQWGHSVLTVDNTTVTVYTEGVPWTRYGGANDPDGPAGVNGWSFPNKEPQPAGIRTDNVIGGKNQENLHNQGVAKFTGWIRYVRIYPTKLTKEEVKKLYDKREE